MKKILIAIAIILIATSNFAGLWNRPIVERIQQDMGRIGSLAYEIIDLINIKDEIVIADSIVYELSSGQKEMLRDVVKQKFLKIRAIVDTICIDYGIE